jgi:hypothetical protein
VKITITILIALMMASCASSPNQRMRNNAVNTSKEYVRAINSCNAKNNQLASNQVVVNNIISNEKNRYELNSSNQKLNDEMKVKFINYLDGITSCRKEVRSKFLDMPYQFREVVINYEDAIDAQYVNLLSNKISIGEFNINREKILSNSNQAIKQVQKEFDNMVQNEKQASTIKNSPSPSSNAIAIGTVCAFTSNPALCASTAINSTSDTNNDRLNEIERKIQRQKYDKIIEDGRLRDVESKLIQQENKKRTDDIINFKTKSLN